MPVDLTADNFVKRMQAASSPAELAKVRRNIEAGKGKYAEGGTFIGVRMQDVFALAKEFVEMPPQELDKLLAHPVHEVRAGALSIMGRQATSKKTPPDRREQLYELYLRHTATIDNWDLVDISAHHVVGAYLVDKPREVLYRLARSDKWWERRIALFATMPFLRRGELDDTFAIAEILLRDEHHFVQTVVGGMLREAGKHDERRLVRFLDEHAAVMPRTALRYAIEHLDPAQRSRYLKK